MYKKYKCSREPSKIKGNNPARVKILEVTMSSPKILTNRREMEPWVSLLENEAD